MGLLGRYLRSASMNVLLAPRYKLSGLGRRAFRVAGPLVWNSIADCLRDPALELASFKRQLRYFSLPAIRQRIERSRDAMTMRYINLLFTYLTQVLILYRHVYHCTMLT